MPQLPHLTLGLHISRAMFQSVKTLESEEHMLNFGLIGYGYWGPNIARNLMSLRGAHLSAISDVSPVARKRAHEAYPGIKITADSAEWISSTEIDAVAVVSPVWTHFELAKAALENGKHVFVEKPFTAVVPLADTNS